MTEDEHPEDVVRISRQIWRLKILRQILILVVCTLALATVVLSEVVVIRYGNSKDDQVADAKAQLAVVQQSINRQSSVATCRAKISGDWVNALDAVIKLQAESLVIVYVQPLDQAALDAKRQELAQALTQLNQADEARSKQDQLCH